MKGSCSLEKMLETTDYDDLDLLIMLYILTFEEESFLRKS